MTVADRPATAELRVADVTAAARVAGGQPGLIPDLFAGPGGWSEGLRMLGLQDVGLESDPATCATRMTAGHLTFEADVATYPTEGFAGWTWGLIASPPCPEFSSANGKRSGLGSESGSLVWEVLRWAEATQPEWIACEQVPAVLPIWRYFASRLEAEGYNTRVGIVDAANYGLPQNRERAILLAHRSRHPVFPQITHTERARSDMDLFGGLKPWVTMADVLGLEPGWVYDSGQYSKTAGGGKERYVRSCDRPCGTLTGQTRPQWVLTKGTERRKVTFAEACLLQGFRDDYPFQGKAEERDQQLGNAVPPPLAALLLSSLTGRFLAKDVAA